jgi:Holliday junction resolvase-like predicted endonuclease
VNESNSNDLSTLANSINQDILDFAGLTEEELKTILKIKMTDIGATLLEEEWTIGGRSDWGCGDLIFELQDTTILVVEVKAIKFESIRLGRGRTKRETSRKRRQEVPNQARFYRDLYTKHVSHDIAVCCATFTDEIGLVIIND